MSKNCIIRLSRYKYAILRLKSIGFVRVFSDNLADAIGVTPAQVRKDFSLFGISGNRRGGYQIEELIGKLNNILGKDQVQKVVLVGAGHLATALMKYKGFEKEGIDIVACFDIDPSKFTTTADVPVYPLDSLKAYLGDHTIRIGIIAVPDIAAQAVLDQLVAAGIKGVLNFAPIGLRGPEGIVINNINLELELENLIYFVNVQQKAERNDESARPQI